MSLSTVFLRNGQYVVIDEGDLMETKYQPTTNLLPEGTHHIISLFFEFAQLKNLYRQGWIKHGRGVDKSSCESVADHCFGVALLGYVLAKEYRADLDADKIMRLGLFHESGEIYAGDMTPPDGVSLEDKAALEYAAAQKVFVGMPNGQEYLGLWLEFEKQETPESRFVKEVDRLEMALQASIYERIGNKGLGDYFPWVQERVNSPELRPILDELIRLR